MSSAFNMDNILGNNNTPRSRSTSPILDVAGRGQLSPACSSVRSSCESPASETIEAVSSPSPQPQQLNMAAAAYAQAWAASNLFHRMASLQNTGVPQQPFNGKNSTPIEQFEEHFQNYL
jgi:hypothetical protein